MARSFDDDVIDDRLRPVSDEERHLKTLFLQALEYEWRPSQMTLPDGSTVPTRRMWLATPFMATRFFEEVLGLGDHGYDIAAHLIATRMDRVERPVRSNLMTRMARAMPDCIMRSAEVHEREVAQFGQVIHRLIAEFPGRFLEWAEDMECDDPWNDLKRQPTTIIRGAFLAASIDARRTVAFWDLAAASDTFPIRMFSDPAEDVALAAPFTPFHLRRYADMFAVMSAPALARFAGHLRRHATGRLAVRHDDGVRTVTMEPLSTAARTDMLRSIAYQVRDPARRVAVEQVLLGVPLDE